MEFTLNLIPPSCTVQEKKVTIKNDRPMICKKHPHPRRTKLSYQPQDADSPVPNFPFMRFLGTKHYLSGTDWNGVSCS